MTYVWGAGDWEEGLWDLSPLIWGTDGWGDDAWAIYNVEDPQPLSTLIDNWPLTYVQPDDGEAIYDVLYVLSLYIQQNDAQLEEIQEQRFLQTATDDDLEKLANEVGITRNTNETDKHLRYRALVRKAGTRSDGTFDSIATVLTVLFGTKADTIEITPVSSSPTIAINIPVTLLEDIPLTESELEEGLQTLTPAGDPLTVTTNDTLILGEEGDGGLGGELV